MLLNITAEVIASFLFFFLGILWKEHILIWLQNLKYDGIDVSGKWVVEENKNTAEGYELSVSTNLSVELKQIANHLSGEAISSIDVKGKKEHIKYKINGEIKDRFIYLVFKLDEKNRISHLIFLLEVLSNGEIMEGYMSFYALRARKINALKTKWKVDK